MALTTCPDCSAEISAAAPACPKCGRPMLPAVPLPVAPSRSVNVVKLVGAVMVAVSVFGGCGLASSLGGGWWAIAAAGVCVSLLVFLAGRFYD